MLFAAAAATGPAVSVKLSRTMLRLDDGCRPGNGESTVVRHAAIAEADVATSTQRRQRRNRREPPAFAP